MTYSSSTVVKALDILDSRKMTAEHEAEQRKKEFVKKHPEYAEIEAKLTQSGIDAVKAIMNCKDPKAYIEGIKKDNLEYQVAKKAFLTANGLSEDYLEPAYHCKKCRDTGYIHGVVCECFEELLKELSAKELSDKTPLQLSSFEDFDPSLYSDATAREKMQKVLDFCKKYADDFDKDSNSLFLYGETGLGKTHLSLAIAAEAIKKGYNAVYGSAHDFFNMIEREHFGRSENPDGTTEEKLVECDLLVIDDLGSEFATQFTVAELYNIINARMARSLPTIISSNINLNELEKQYNKRITSRIIGTYKVIQFVGNDIRQIK